MSIDRSLKIKGAFSRHRNVLKRGERIEALAKEERWEEGQSVTGLPKVAHRKIKAGKKKEEAAPVAGAEAAAATTATTAAAPAEKPAAAAKKPKA